MVFSILDHVEPPRTVSLPQFSARWCNGSTGDFDSPSHGSNPCRAAIRRAPLAHGLRPARPRGVHSSLMFARPRRMALSKRSASNGLVRTPDNLPTGFLLEPHFRGFCPLSPMTAYFPAISAKGRGSRSSEISDGKRRPDLRPGTHDLQNPRLRFPSDCVNFEYIPRSCTDPKVPMLERWRHHQRTF